MKYYEFIAADSVGKRLDEIAFDDREPAMANVAAEAYGLVVSDRFGVLVHVCESTGPLTCKELPIAPVIEDGRRIATWRKTQLEAFLRKGWGDVK